MSDWWIRLEKGRYINIGNVIKVERGPVGHGVRVVFVDGTDQVYSGNDAATIIAHFEEMLVH